MKTLDDLSQEPKNILIRNPLSQKAKKNCLVDTRKALPHVALEDPDGLRTITRNLTREGPEPIERFVRALPISTGVRVGNKRPIEEGIQNAVDRMMHESVSDGGFVDIARLRIVHLERLVAARLVGFVLQVLVQGEEVVHEVQFEGLDVWLIFLSFQKLLPRREEIVGRDDIMVSMNQSLFHTSQNTPPHGFCQCCRS